jgi:hypothetical protein
MLWSEMKGFVRDCFCKTPEEVATAIENFRKSLTLEKLKSYIMKIKEVFKIKKLFNKNYK